MGKWRQIEYFDIKARTMGSHCMVKPGGHTDITTVSKVHFQYTDFLRKEDNHVKDTTVAHSGCDICYMIQYFKSALKWSVVNMINMFLTTSKTTPYWDGWCPDHDATMMLHGCMIHVINIIRKKDDLLWIKLFESPCIIPLSSKSRVRHLKSRKKQSMVYCSNSIVNVMGFL